MFSDYAYYDMDMTISFTLKNLKKLREKFKKVLVTGGAGYIGSSVSYDLIKEVIKLQ